MIEYLDAFVIPETPMIPPDRREAWKARMRDRIFDQHLQAPMQKIVTDPHGVGDRFGLADCSAAPALFCADVVKPFGEEHPGLRAYLARLKARPSFARVLSEAAPYFGMFQLEVKPKI